MSDIVKWEPFKEISKMFEEMDKIFAPFFKTFSEEINNRSFLTSVPNLDIQEENGEIVVTGKVPNGVKDNLDVVVHQNRVTVSGEESSSKEHAGTKEFQWSKFTRTFFLPAKVKSEKATVNLENGVLKIRAPKE